MASYDRNPPVKAHKRGDFRVRGAEKPGFLRDQAPTGHRRRGRIPALLGLAAFLGATALGACAARQVSVSRRAAVIKQFDERIEHYVELHKRMAKNLPTLPDKTDAAAISKHKQALAELIRAERKGARQGDIFYPAAAKLIRQILVAEMHGRAGKEERKTIKEGNPKVEGTTAPVTMAVNAKYPDAAPLSSVPSGVLLNLPKLPEELEYRFVGRDMILHDVAANLIVDFIREAAPKS